MEWVETTGRSLEEAKDSALDELGVDETDAEFEVLEEPRPGLFGRVRGQARVRARVRPAQPRAKVDRRDRRRSHNRKRSKSEAKSLSDRSTEGEQPASQKDASPGATAKTVLPNHPGATEPAAADAGGDAESADNHPGGPTMTTTDLDAGSQAAIVEEFLGGLVRTFGVEGTVATSIENEVIQVEVSGEDLGLLIGPKGTTLNAVQELARTVVQRKANSPNRLRVDVGGYRERRREALARFTRQVAAEVARDGTPKALEPMSAADRKVVHDTANEIDGVSTRSEGEEPRRWVVITPDA